MKSVDIKLKLEKFINLGMYTPHGPSEQMFAIRVCCKYEIGFEMALRQILESLKIEEEKVSEKSFNAREVYSYSRKWLASIENEEPAYKKVGLIDIDGCKYYYYQFFYITDSKQLHERFIHELIRNHSLTTNNLYARTASINKDIVYSLSQTIFQGGTKTIIYYPSNISEVDEKNILFKIFGGKYDVAHTLSLNCKKSYNPNALVKAKICFYDDIAEAFNRTDLNTVNISACNMYGNFIFKNIEYRNDTHSFNFVKLYNNKIKACFVSDTLILYDGNSALRDSSEIIKDISNMNISRLQDANKKIRIIYVLQFGEFKNYINHIIPYNNGETQLSTVVLEFRDKRNIILNTNNTHYTGHSFQSSYIYIKGKKRTQENINIGNLGQSIASKLIIPYSENTQEYKEVLKVIQDLYANSFSLDERTDEKDESFIQLCRKYVRLLDGNVESNENDILTDWFDSCVKGAKREDEQILSAYIKMKMDLEKEYKELGIYLNNVDFSHCNPVPSVLIDDKMLKNYYKTLHLKLKNDIIKKIKNKKIEPIEITRVVFDMLIVSGGNSYMGTIPLKQLYNPKSNEIVLDYLKMRGAIVHDKT